MNDASTPTRLRNSTGIAVTANRTHHETSDHYDDIIVHLAPRWRVIACRDRIQWIVQKRSSKHLNKGKWLGKWYLHHPKSVNCDLFKLRIAHRRCCNCSIGSLA